LDAPPTRDTRHGLRHHQRRDPPAQASPDGEAVHGPVRHVRRVRLAMSEDEIDSDAGAAEAHEDLALVRLAAGRALGRHATVRRANAHHALPVATMSEPPPNAEKSERASRSERSSLARRSRAGKKQ